MTKRFWWCLALWSQALTAKAVSQAPGAVPVDSIERFVHAEMTRQHVPGMSILIMRGDSVLLSRGFGYANVELGVPASDSTVYQSGSVGKQFTSALVLMLVERGRLKISDPIIRFLPEGKHRWRGVTVRHLLNHTSGIPDYTDSTVNLMREYTEDQLVRLAATLPLDFAPGDRWSYSNTGYLLLGAIIHRVTGSFYGDLLASEFFHPLGMPSARIISEADIVPNRSAGYELSKGKLRNQEWVSPSLNTTADGSLYLSLRDYQRWIVALNHGQLPSRAVLKTAWTPAVLNHGSVYPYGMGWFLLPQRNFVRRGHTGAWQGFETSIQRYPEFDLSVVALSNLAGSTPGPLSETIAGIIEPKLAPAHTLASESTPGADEARVPFLLRSLASGAMDSTRVTPALRRFAVPAWRRELAADLAGADVWEWMGCDSLPGGLLVYLDRPISRTCYVRSRPRSRRLLVSAYYSADDRLAGVETYHF